MSLSTEAISERYATSLQATSEIANAYYFQGRLDEALRLFQAGEQWLSLQEVSPEHKLSFLLKYGQFVIHYYFMTNSEEERMRSLAQQARQLAEARQDAPGIATALYLIGQTLYYHNLQTGESDYLEARSYFEQSSTLYERLNDSYNLAESLFYTGLTYERQHQDAQAQEYYQRALQLAESSSNVWGASEATRHLAGLYMSIDLEQSLNYALKSLALREEIGFKRALPSAQLLISDVYVERGNLEQALEYCQQAEQLAREMKLQNYLVYAQVTHGDIAYKQGKRDEARTHFEKAASLARQLNIAFAIAVVNEKLEMIKRE